MRATCLHLGSLWEPEAQLYWLQEKLRQHLISPSPTPCPVVWHVRCPCLVYEMIITLAMEQT